MAIQTPVYRIRFRLNDEYLPGDVKTIDPSEAREKIRDQLKREPLTGIDVWEDGRKLTSAEKTKLIGMPLV